MTKTLSLSLAVLAGLGLLACGDDSSGNGQSVTADSSSPGPGPAASTPAAVTTVIIVQGEPGPAGPPGPPGRDGVPAPGAVPAGSTPSPVATTPTPTATGTGASGGASAGGAGGAPGMDDVTILVGYDADIPGSEAGDNTMFMDADMMPLMVTPDLGTEGTTTYAEFMIPFDGSAPQQFGWNTELPGGPMDLTGMELVVRLRWVSGFNPDDAWGGLQMYAWSDDWGADISNWQSLDPATKGTWVEYTLDLSTADEADADPMFNPAAVNAIGYTFNTGGEAAAPPAATEALFQIDYVGVRPIAGAGAGGGGTGGAPAGGAGAGGTTPSGGAGGAMAGAGGSSAGTGGGPAGGAAAGGTPADAGAP